MAEYKSKRPRKVGELQRAWDEMDDERRKVEVTLGYGEIKNAPFHIRHQFDALVSKYEGLLHKKP